MTLLLIAGAVLALVIGLWVGLGAPGWPNPPEGRSRRLAKRSLNPVAWARGTRRERPTPRTRQDRRDRLR